MTTGAGERAVAAMMWMTPQIRRVGIQAPRWVDYLLDYFREFFGRERLGNPSRRSARKRDSAHAYFLQAGQDDHGRRRRTNINGFENR